MTLFINNIEINIDDDIKISRFHNKSLENVTLNFTILDEPLDIKIKDYVALNGVNYYLMDFEEVEFTYEGYKRYEYTVNLVEPTIDLYDIILPNRALRRRTSRPRKTAVQVIEEYLLIYAPHIKISATLRVRLGSSIVGDFAWNNPTLFEVINDIIRAENNIIPVMYNFTEINFKDLDAIGVEINNANIDIIMRRNDYNEYGNALRYNITDGRFVDNKNAIFKDNAWQDLETEKTYVVEFIKPETLNNPILKDDDWAIYTEHPIDEVYEMQLIAWRDVFWAEMDNVDRVEFDMTDNIVEKGVYETLKPTNEGGTVTGNYKRSHVYYERGKNVIDGFNYTDSLWYPIVDSVGRTWKNLFKIHNDSIIISNYKPRTFIIVVAYKPMIKDIAGNSLKNASKINRTIISGQQEKTVNIANFGKYNRDVLDMLGEDELIIKGSDNPPAIMDFYDGFYVYKIDVEDSDGGINWQAYLKRNYNEINISTALNYDKNIFERADVGDTVLSNHINNINYTLMPVASDLSEGNKNIVDFFTRNAFSWGGGYSIRQFYAFIKMRYSKNETSVWFIKNMLPITVDNSFLLHFKMQDNFSVGTGLITSTFIGELENKEHGITQPLIPYVDDNGEFQSFDIRVYNGVYRFPLDIDDAKDIKEYPVARRGVLPGYNSLDAVYDKLMYEADDIPRYKDTREITAETLQFNFLGNDKLIFYPQIFERNRLAVMMTETIEVSFILHVNRDENKKYNRFTRILGDAEGSFTYDDVSITVNIDGAFYGWAIYEKNDSFDTYKPLLAYNGSDKKLYWDIVKPEFEPPTSPYEKIWFRIRDKNNNYILEQEINKKPIKIINNGERVTIKHSDESEVLFTDLLENYKNSTNTIQYTYFYFDDGIIGATARPKLKVKITDGINTYEGYAQRYFLLHDQWWFRYSIIGYTNNGGAAGSMDGYLYNPSGSDINFSIGGATHEIEVTFDEE